jgi:hypothetical protein
MKMNKRTNIDFTKHELITKVSDDFKMWKLKLPNTITESISFINTQGILVVTGDYGDFTFCREFHPTKDQIVSDEYWCEKYRISTQHQTDYFDEDETLKLINSNISDFEDIQRDLDEHCMHDSQMEPLLKYYQRLRICLPNMNEQEYVHCAYQEYIPPFLSPDDVPYCQSIEYKFLIVFDAFEEICSRL